MAKSCNLKFSLANAKAFTELKKYCGNNDTQFFNYLVMCSESSFVSVEVYLFAHLSKQVAIIYILLQNNE